MMNGFLVKFTDNKTKDIIINILVLLFGINFLYRSNYILVFLCLTIFILNNFKIKLGNKYLLILLTLFALSWYIFSNDHDINGICLPISYLIGCNLKKENEDNVINFIILIAFSFALYTSTFFFNNAIVNGIASYDVNNQPNIWTGRPLWPTNIMLYSSLFMSLFGYFLFIEKSQKIRIIYLVIFIINGIYSLLLSRRAALLLVIISTAIAFLYKMFTGNRKEIKHVIKIISLLIAALLFAIVFICLAYKFNLLNLREFIRSTDLYVRFIRPHSLDVFFKDSGRMMVKKQFIGYMPQYPWGGQHISVIINFYVHELWLDVYDYAGIVPYILIVIYSIVYLIEIIQIIRNKNISISFKALLIILTCCCTTQLFLEPIMQACKNYMFALCMIHGSLYTLKDNKNA